MPYLYTYGNNIIIESVGITPCQKQYSQKD